MILGVYRNRRISLNEIMSRDSEETEEEEIVFKTRKLSLVSNDFEGKKKELIKVPFVVCPYIICTYIFFFSLSIV